MRSGQNKRKVFIAIIIAGIAASAVYLLFQDLNNKLDLQGQMLFQQNKVISSLNKGKKSKNATKSKKYNFIVAKQDIKKGEKLTSEMLNIKEYSVDMPGAYSKISDILNKISIKDIKEGNVITSMDFVERSFENGYIPKGMRIITIPINFVQGVASYIKVGSKVDVISAQNNKTSEPDYILQNVEVVALEPLKTVKQDGEITAVQASSISLQIPALKASKVVNAMQNGKIHFISRGMSDNSILQNREPEIKPLSEPPELLALPEPAIPEPERESVEMIQANIKSEITFDN